MRPTTHHRRVASGLLAGALLLAPLAACGDTTESDVLPETTGTESAPAEDTSAEASGSEDAGSGGDASADVDCAGTSCTVTLTGVGAEADILGTTVVLDTVADGRATISAGGREVSCGEGESVSAGPLTLECTTVDQDAVTMTASLG